MNEMRENVGERLWKTRRAKEAEQIIRHNEQMIFNERPVTTMEWKRMRNKPDSNWFRAIFGSFRKRINVFIQFSQFLLFFWNFLTVGSAELFFFYFSFAVLERFFFALKT